jgi:NitT/TauT family transport system permease protein
MRNAAFVRFLRGSRTVDIAMVLLGTILLWEVGVWLFNPPSIILPPPSAIWAAFIQSPSVFLRNMLYTLSTTAIAFAFSVGLGVVMAVGIVQSRFIERTLYTMLIAVNSVPKVALAPLFVIWLGTGMSSQLAVAVMLAIFPIVINTVLGFRSVDPDMLNLAKATRASKFDVIYKIRVPNALPSLFSGMKVGISFALVGAIVGEFVAGGRGLGFLVLTAQGQFDTTRVFVSLVLLGLLGTILFYLVDIMERVTLPWHSSQRQPAT